MDNLTTDFLSFFVPYMGFILLSSLVLSLALSEHHILAARYYARKWERVVSETIREKDEAKREVELLRNTKTAEIERLTKKVATLEGELSALRANLSKHNEL